MHSLESTLFLHTLQACIGARRVDANAVRLLLLVLTRNLKTREHWESQLRHLKGVG